MAKGVWLEWRAPTSRGPTCIPVSSWHLGDRWSSAQETGVAQRGEGEAVRKIKAECDVDRFYSSCKSVVNYLIECLYLYNSAIQATLFNNIFIYFFFICIYSHFFLDMCMLRMLFFFQNNPGFVLRQLKSRQPRYNSFD